MDFYVDIAVAVLLRLVKDRRSVAKYYSALAKVYNALLMLMEVDPVFAKFVDSHVRDK